MYSRPFNEVYACGMSPSPEPRPFTNSFLFFSGFQGALVGSPSIADLPPTAEPDTLVPLPETADKVQTDEDQCADLIAYVRAVAPPLRDAPVTARQACYIPRHIRFGEQRSPLVGPALIPGLWVASGHTAWGIQNGPATGLLMAEYILEGEAKSADASKLDPRLHKV
jgi:glycine/D-amino acid oxidase-like deaminating enzyme